jgi:hypothetical protein
MGTAQQALDVARHWVGYAEGPNNQSAFGAWFGLDHNPWCAMFFSYCTYTSGTPCPATTSKGFAYCPSGVNWFKSRKAWFSKPQVGDAVFFDWDGDGTSDHIGIVEVVHADGSVGTIEGNADNQVERRTRSGRSVMGFGRPAYAGATSKPTVTPKAPPPKPAPAPTHPRWPGRFLALTSPYTRGDDVRAVQTRLNSFDERLQEDGIYGRLTEAEVKHFQTARHLEVDGVVGPVTWDALYT